MKTVNVRGVNIGEGRTKIFSSLCGKDLADLVDQAHALRGIPVDVAEWRLDWFDQVFDTEALLAAAKVLRETLGDMPILATFRSKAEGGEKEVEPAKYAELNKALAESDLVDIVDIETFMDDAMVPQLIADVHAADKFALLSNHDFEKTPSYDQIIANYQKMQDLGADIAKISYWPNSRKDVLMTLDATREMFENHAEIPLLCVSMSPLGTLARLTGEFVGSCATFGAAKQASAPGQVDVKSLDQVLNTLHAAL